MTYQMFLDKQGSEKFAAQYAMRHEVTDTGLFERLLKVIKPPKWYTDVSELESIVIYQGQAMIDKPHYEKKEQIMCAVDGDIKMYLVPHLNRQEIYCNQKMEDSSYDERKYDSSLYGSQNINVNTSPINFFSDNSGKILERWPHYENAQRKKIELSKGDCAFIPAYNFYHMYAQNGFES